MRVMNHILLVALALQLLTRNVNSNQECVCAVLRHEISSLQEETEALHDSFAICRRAELDALKTVDDLRQQLTTDCSKSSSHMDNVVALEKELSLLKHEQTLLKEKLEYSRQQVKASHFTEAALQSELKAALDQVKVFEDDDEDEDEDDDDDIVLAVDKNKEEEDEEVEEEEEVEREHLTSTITALEQQLQGYEAMIRSLKSAKSSELLQIQQQLETTKQDLYSTRNTAGQYKAKYDQLAEHHAITQDQLTGLVEAIAVREKYEQMLVEKGAMLREREAAWLPYWLTRRFLSLGRNGVGTTTGTEVFSEVVGTVGTAGKKVAGRIKQSVQQVYTNRIAPLLPHTFSATTLTKSITFHLSTASHTIGNMTRKAVGPVVSWLPDKHQLKTTTIKFWKLRIKPALKMVEASVEKVVGEGYATTVTWVKQGVAKAGEAAKEKMMEVEDAVVERLSVSFPALLPMPFVTVHVYRIIVRGVIVVGVLLWGLVVIAVIASRKGNGRKKMQAAPVVGAAAAVPSSHKSDQKVDTKKKKNHHQQQQHSTKSTEDSSSNSMQVKKSENGVESEIAAVKDSVQSESS